MHFSARPGTSVPPPAARRAAALTAAALTGATALLLATTGPSASSAAAELAGQFASAEVPPAAQAAKQVPIEKDTYTPAALTVKPGDTVTWKNLDAKPHTVTVTAGPEKFDSGLFAKGKSWSYTFDKLGTYEYYCSAHPDMVGTVNVTRNGKAPAAPTAGSEHGGHSTSPGTGPAGGLLGPLLPGSVQPASGVPAGSAEADPVGGVLSPFQQHLVSAHFTRTVGGQVEDLLAADSYVRSHTALFRMMLDGAVGKQSPGAGAPAVGPFLSHMDAAHWYRSPAEQASDIAEFDAWAKSHEALFRVMLDPAVGKSSPAATSAGTGPFMQHMDAAHWNRSPGEQVNDISMLDRWLANHAALIQRMLGSSDSGPSKGAPAPK